jgi:hypothetical protein
MNTEPEQEEGTVTKSSEGTMASKEKWLKQPDSQGWWWHWDECPEHSPFIYSILTSLSRKINREFIASPDSRWCVDVGGLWMKVEEPSTEAAWQNAGESLPAEPVAPVEANEKDQCSANLGMYECRLDYGHSGDHDDQGVKWLNSFNVAEPKPSPSTPDRVQIALRRIMNRVEVISKAGEFDVRDFQFIENELLDVWDHHSLKPQPDSSSISTGPMPEQLVSELALNRALRDPNSTTENLLAKEVVQLRKWAAAKGSTEVEGK